MNVPLLNIAQQNAALRPEIEDAIARVLDTNAFILGGEVAALEAELAAYGQVKHAIGCASGSDAIVLALIAPARVVSVAFDAGSVTTGVLSAPVVIAVTIGLSSVLAGRSAISDGFGILGFASIGPVVIVLLMGILLS